MNHKEKRRTLPANFLGETLREWRDKNRWPLKRVATELNVSESTCSRWESGDRFPSPKQMQKLAALLQVPVCRFFYAKSSPCPSCGHQRSSAFVQQLTTAQSGSATT
ncbi:MAG: helix-turn-helix transcriptional regulator [Verrucomicrobia bacterium]|nr:helix-turn-helix transcriptional regulator [Verrucomicrobiota bacterium]